MKLAFSTLGCPDWNLKEILATAKDFGFDGVEIRGVKNEIYAPKIPDFCGEKLGGTREKLERLGVEIPMVTSGVSIRHYNPDEETEKNGKIVAEAKEYAELAARLGARYVRILADIDVAPGEPVEDRAVIGAMKAILAATEALPIVFLLETNGAYANSRRLADVVEAIGSPRAAVLWDVHHPYRYFGEMPEITWKNLGKYVRYVHVKDSVVLPEGNIQYRMMGKGDLPLKEIFRLLRENGYDGYVSLEWVKRWMRELEAPGIVFVQYVNYMRKVPGFHD